MTGKARLLDACLRALSAPLRCLPRRWRARALQLLVEAEDRRGAAREALMFLLDVAAHLDRAIDRAAIAYGGGTHPKHRLTGYHDFFIARVPPGARVLDVGCGRGELAADIAARVPGCAVIAMDLDAVRIAEAREKHRAPNLRFERADALERIPEGRFDVVILSNVLEHIGPRVALLRRLREATGARRFLLRVPLSERHWHVPLRRELGLPHFSDPTHRTEHTPEELEAELAGAGLRTVEREVRWGEAWVACEPAEAGP